MKTNSIDNAIMQTAYDLSMELPAKNNRVMSYIDHFGVSRNEIPDFYTFMEIKLIQYIKKIKLLDPGEIQMLLRENVWSFSEQLDFKGFIKLCETISHESMECLGMTMRGDLISASKILSELLWGKTLSPYLDSEINFFFLLSEIITDLEGEFYRVRDAGSDEEVKDCWHVPYELRHKAWSGRFGLAGFPVLYLANTLEAAKAEVGRCGKDKVRWIQTFKAKPRCGLRVVDLTIPTPVELRERSDSLNLQFLMSYPLILLCSVKANYLDDANCNEYLFAQTLMHTLIHNSTDYEQLGVLYTSSKVKMAKCLALPAIMSQGHPQTAGHSKLTMSHWICSRPLRI